MNARAQGLAVVAYRDGDGAGTGFPLAGSIMWDGGAPEHAGVRVFRQVCSWFHRDAASAAAYFAHLHYAFSLIAPLAPDNVCLCHGRYATQERGPDGTARPRARTRYRDHVNRTDFRHWLYVLEPSGLAVVWAPLRPGGPDRVLVPWDARREPRWTDIGPQEDR